MMGGATMEPYVFRGVSYVTPAGEIRHGVDIRVEGGRIASISESSGGQGGRGSGTGTLLLPGFYNIHSHVPMTLLRGYGEGLPLSEWLFGKMIPFEQKLSDEDCYWGALAGIAEMIASGTVSFTDMYMHMPGIVRAVEESGIKANLSHGFSQARPGDSFLDSNARRGTDFTRQAAARIPDGRLVADASLHAEYTTREDRAVRELAEWCAGNGMRMHVHISETRKEHEECKARRGGRTPAAFLADCGLFDSPTTAAHCVWVEESDLDIFADKGVTVAHCPSSNLKLGSGMANMARCLDRGIRVGIGTDGAASNNNLDMLEETRLAGLLQKGVSGDSSRFGPGELLRMACRFGADAQGRTDCGEIRVGAWADIVAYDLGGVHLHPAHDLLSNIFFSAAAADIRTVMVNGRVLYQDGEFTTIDISRVIAEVDRIAAKHAAGSA